MKNFFQTLIVLLASLSISVHAAENIPIIKKRTTRTTETYHSFIRHTSQDSNFGIGILLGEPTGVSAKFFLDPKTAIDAGLAYSFDSFFMVFGDYLWHLESPFTVDNDFTRRLKIYVGGGAGLKFSSKNEFERIRDHDDSVEVFVRVPVGAEWRPIDPPIGVFVELGPGLKLIPGASAMFFGDIGIRFYF